MLYIGNTKYRIYSGRDRVSIESPKKVVYYEYCRNTTTTILDTGIAASNNTRLEFKLWGNVTESFYSMGTRINATGSQLFSLTGSRNDQSVQFSIGYVTTELQNLTRTSGGYTYSGWYQTNGDMTYSYYLKDEETNTEYNGSNISYTQSLVNNNLHIFLFSNGYNNIVPQLRFYYVRIYQDGVLVRDFRPAKVNGVDGFYDKVTKQLFTTDNLAVGGSEIQYYDYLQNDGVAYIDTEIKNIVNSEFELVAQLTELINGGYPTLLGATEGTNTYKTIIACGINFFGQPSGKGNSTIIGSLDLNKHTFKAQLGTDSATYRFDNIDIVEEYPITTGTTYSLFLFARNNQGTANNNVKQKVYSLKIKDNGVLVRDFKPCYYQGQAGLWDSVECKFYGNANSVGVLMVGNNS